MIRVTIVTVGLLAMSACAPSSIGPDERAGVVQERQCFLPQTIRNYRPDGDATVYVRDGRNAVYQVATSGCRGLSASRVFSLTPNAGGNACVGDTVTVTTAGPSIRNENNSLCSARVMKRLTAEDVAALPSRLKP